MDQILLNIKCWSRECNQRLFGLKHLRGENKQLAFNLGLPLKDNEINYSTYSFVEYFGCRLFLTFLTFDTPSRDKYAANWPACKHNIHYPPIGSILDHQGKPHLLIGYSSNIHGGLLLSEDLNFMDKRYQALELDNGSKEYHINLLSYDANLLFLYGEKQLPVKCLVVDQNSCLDIKIIDFDYRYYHPREEEGQLALNF